MTRANSIIVASLATFLAVAGAATAAPFAAPQNDAKPQAQRVDYRRCWIEDGERICRYVSEDPDVYSYDDDYDYDPGPGVVLGFGGMGHGDFHGGHDFHGGDDGHHH